MPINIQAQLEWNQYLPQAKKEPLSRLSVSLSFVELFRLA